MADQTSVSGDRLSVPRDSLSATDALALGREIRIRREALGLTQENLAEKSGVTRNQIQVIERGWADRAKKRPANPRLATIIGLCEALDMRVRIDVSQSSRVNLEYERPSL
jgi:transcriptional regulator with XRE-family HTH domain